MRIDLNRGLLFVFNSFMMVVQGGTLSYENLTFSNGVQCQNHQIIQLSLLLSFNNFHLNLHSTLIHLTTINLFNPLESSTQLIEEITRAQLTEIVRDSL